MKKSEFPDDVVKESEFPDDVVKESEFPDDLRNGDDADLPETYSDDGDAEGLPPTQCNLILVCGCVNISSSMPLCTSPVSAVKSQVKCS